MNRRFPREQKSSRSMDGSPAKRDIPCNRPLSGIRTLAGSRALPGNNCQTVMTIRRRLILSFTVILALFAVNLVVYFWSSHKRADSVDQLQRAVTRQLKIQTVQQKINEVKS